MTLSSGRGLLGALLEGGRFVGSAGADDGVKDVGASAGEAEQRCGVGLALGASPVVVGAAGGVAETGECGQEERSLEGLVSEGLTSRRSTPLQTAAGPDAAVRGDERVVGHD